MKITHLILSTFAVFSLCIAADSPPSNVPNLANSFVSVLLSLGIVIGIILVCVWVLKKVGGNHFSNDASIDVIGNKMIGPKERLMIVRVADKNLLLGITANNITKLQELPDDFMPQDKTQKVSFQHAFSEQLAKMMGSGRNA